MTDPVAEKTVCMGGGLVAPIELGVRVVAEVGIVVEVRPRPGLYRRNAQPLVLLQPEL